jgi:hypothetical protein
MMIKDLLQQNFYLTINPNLYSLFSSMKNHSKLFSFMVLSQTQPSINHHQLISEYYYLQMQPFSHFNNFTNQLHYLIFY